MTTVSATARRMPASVDGSARIVAVDLARFLAIVGMIAAHLMLGEGPGWTVEATSGFPSTLFAMIGGVSAILSTRRYSAEGQHLAAAFSLAGRGLVVALLGVLLGLAPGYVIVVLVYFGATLIVASLFVRMPPLALFATAGITAAAGPFVNLAIRDGVAVGSPGELSFGSPLQFVASIGFTGTYPVITWLVYVLVGMAVGKLVLGATPERTRFAIRLTIVGAAMTAAASSADVLSRDFVLRQLVNGIPMPPEQAVELVDGEGFGGPVAAGWAAVVNATAHTGSVGDIVRTLGASLAILGILLLVTRRLASPMPWLLRPLARAGGAPLTVYTLHVIATFIMLGALTTADSTDSNEWPWWFSGPGILALHVAGVIAVGIVLTALGRRGPLETLTTAVARRFARLGVWLAAKSRVG